MAMKISSQCTFEIQTVSECLTSANGQDVYTQEEWSFGTTVCQQTWDTRDNHKNVRKTTDGDTTTDELEATGLGIGEPSEKHRQGICQHRERLGGSGRLLGTETQSTGGLLGSSRWCSGSASMGWKSTVDVVGEEAIASTMEIGLVTGAVG